MELRVTYYGELSPRDALDPANRPGLVIDEYPADPWPDGVECCLWVEAASAAGVRVARSGDAYQVTLARICTFADYQLALGLAAALRDATGATLHEGELPCDLAALEASAEERWRGELATSCEELREFIGENGPVYLTGYLRTILVGPRTLTRFAEVPSLADALVHLLGELQDVADGYHSPWGVARDDEGQAYACLCVDVPQYFPVLNTVYVDGPEGIKAVEPVKLWLALGDRVEWLDEEQVYVAPLSATQHAEVYRALPELELDTSGWGPPAEKRELDGVVRLGHRIQALEALTRAPAGVEPVGLLLGRAYEERSDLLARVEGEQALADMLAAVQRYGQISSPQAETALGVARAKLADLYEALERPEECAAERERAWALLAARAGEDEGAAHALYLVAKDLATVAWSSDDEAGVVRAYDRVLAEPRLLRPAQRAAALAFRAEARTWGEEIAACVADLLEAHELLAELDEDPYEAALTWSTSASDLVERFALGEDERRRLLELGVAAAERFLAAGWLPPIVFAKVAKGWVEGLELLGAHEERLGLARRSLALFGEFPGVPPGDPEHDVDLYALWLECRVPLVVEEAEALDDLGRHAEAYRLARSVVDDALRQRDRSSRSAAALDLASVLLDNGDVDAALALCEGVEADQAAWNFLGQSLLVRVAALLELGRVEDCEAALARMREFQSLLTAPVQVEGAHAVLLIREAQVLRISEDWAQVRARCEEALPILESHMLLEGLQIGCGDALTGYRLLGEACAQLGASEAADKAWRAWERVARDGQRRGSSLRRHRARCLAARARCSEGETRRALYEEARALLNADVDGVLLCELACEAGDAGLVEVAVSSLDEEALAVPHRRRLASRLRDASADLELPSAVRARLVSASE